MDKTEKKRKELDCNVREKVAGYFFDMSKLTFAGVAVGSGISFINDPTSYRFINVMFFGIYLTFMFAYVAYKLLKLNTDILCTN